MALYLPRSLRNLHDDLWSDFESIFDHSLSRFLGKDVTLQELSSIYHYPIDFHEKNGKYEIVTNCPGFSSEELDIQIDKNTITITGNKTESNENNAVENPSFFRKERRSSKFSRSISIPTDANMEDIKADLKNGVLSLSISKKDTQPSVKKIKINSQ